MTSTMLNRVDGGRGGGCGPTKSRKVVIVIVDTQGIFPFRMVKWRKQRMCREERDKRGELGKFKMGHEPKRGRGAHFENYGWILLSFLTFSSTFLRQGETAVDSPLSPSRPPSSV